MCVQASHRNHSEKCFSFSFFRNKNSIVTDGNKYFEISCQDIKFTVPAFFVEGKQKSCIWSTLSIKIGKLNCFGSICPNYLELSKWASVSVLTESFWRPTTWFTSVVVNIILGNRAREERSPVQRVWSFWFELKSKFMQIYIFKFSIWSQSPFPSVEYK